MMHPFTTTVLLDHNRSRILKHLRVLILCDTIVIRT
jgi:hypothetical protein